MLKKRRGFAMKTAIIPFMIALALLLTACGSKVDETASGDVVGKIEKSDLGSGRSASTTLDLSPGKYVFICNVSGHYEDGMYVAFEVTAGDAPKSTTVLVGLGKWYVNPDREAVATGPITFKVANGGNRDHDFVIIKTDLAAAALVLN
jgi:uncharacterized cupredoxin-like copper-binding protein